MIQHVGESGGVGMITNFHNFKFFHGINGVIIGFHDDLSNMFPLCEIKETD